MAVPRDVLQTMLLLLGAAWRPHHGVAVPYDRGGGGEEEKKEEQKEGEEAEEAAAVESSRKGGEERFNLDGYYPKTVRLSEVPGYKRKG